MSRKKVVILGAGLIGKTIAADLSDRYDVVCADYNSSALENVKAILPVQTVELDFTDEDALRSVIEPFDLVVGAVPGHLGFKVLRTIIDAGKNAVDISFFPEDPFQLDRLARDRNVTAVVDCGVAPGLCNIIAGYHYSIGKLLSYECLVGGLPVERVLPFEYKAGFSPADVIEEYTREATYIADSKLMHAPALSQTEHIYAEGIGNLESFITDGLRTLITTMRGTRFMKEKTLRYPGHAALMTILRDTGFFSKEKIRIGNASIAPLELTSKLLFPHWQMKKGDEDFTYMRVTLEDVANVYEYTLMDRCDTVNGISSMARTTGYTCTAVATLLLEEKYTKAGICPPENIGGNFSCFTAVFDYLSKRNVNVQVNSTRKTIANVSE